MRIIVFLTALALSVPCFAEQSIGVKCTIYGHLAGVTMQAKNNGETRDQVLSSLQIYIATPDGKQNISAEDGPLYVQFVGRVYDAEAKDQSPRVVDGKYYGECVKTEKEKEQPK